jgi:hypothetical protein
MADLPMPTGAAEGSQMPALGRDRRFAHGARFPLQILRELSIFAAA